MRATYEHHYDWMVWDCSAEAYLRNVRWVDDDSHQYAVLTGALVGDAFVEDIRDAKCACIPSLKLALVNVVDPDAARADERESVSLQA